MVRLADVEEPLRTLLVNLDCPSFETTPCASGPPLRHRRVALVSTAGLHLHDDRPFVGVSTEYRLIPGSARASDLLMSHMSVNYDRSGWELDWNMAFPLDRLRELAEEGVIGSIADFHYSLMGATDPRELEDLTGLLVSTMRKDGVDAALLVPI
ncbi:MAG TPA: glycine/sarcosine/betaine reductase selenoprotein B family protein [Actinomycetota bacterium]|jgi:D-proline reductase (dithiol) PrdB|nr:glycine/sarcosine/betaine reductase selenoprotein B family protein [Actinomycetota bacterium]